jgi:hypothetical protein
MPIRQYLNGHRFDEETVRVLGVAFVITRVALKLENKEGPAQRTIAAKLIELAQQGERDPDRLAEQVLAMVDAMQREAPALAEAQPAPRADAIFTLAAAQLALRRA